MCITIGQVMKGMRVGDDQDEELPDSQKQLPDVQVIRHRPLSYYHVHSPATRRSHPCAVCVACGGRAQGRSCDAVMTGPSCVLCHTAESYAGMILACEIASRPLLLQQPLLLS